MLHKWCVYRTRLIITENMIQTISNELSSAISTLDKVATLAHISLGTDGRMPLVGIKFILFRGTGQYEPTMVNNAFQLLESRMTIASLFAEDN